MSSAAAPLTLRRSLALLWRSLRSMRTALILLLLVALGALVGSLVPQSVNSPLRVAQEFVRHPLRARLFDHPFLDLYDVYGSWWFTLLYALLLVSLGACLVPRTRAFARNLRSKPQPARELDALRHYAERPVVSGAGEAIAASARVLRRRLFRVNRPADTASAPALAADKGLAREGGSLLFHWSFFLLLIGVLIGKGTGFTGFAVITEGECWTEAAPSYDGNLRPGRFFDVGDHTGAQVCVKDFGSTFRETGQPMDFVTLAELRDASGALARTVEIRVNEPASIEGVSFYQFAFGWAPVIEVRDAGRLIASGPVEFERDPVPEGVGELEVPWHGVVRLPTLRPQVGIQFQLWPDSRAFLEVLKTREPVFMPRAFRPLLRYEVFEGDLASELRPDFARLDTAGLTRVGDGIVGSGTTVELFSSKEIIEPGPPGRIDYGDGLTVTFPQLRQYTVLQVGRDPGVWIMLAAAVLILLGLVPALYTSRRRIWVRAEDGEAGTVLKVGGFALQRTSQFEEEFTRLVDELARASGGTAGAASESEKVGSSK